MRTASKAVVDEMRNAFRERRSTSPLGATLGIDGVISLVVVATPDESAALSEILAKLRNQAKEGTIRAAAICHFVDNRMHDGTMAKQIYVHMEHATGKAFRAVVPSGEAALNAGVPGVNGPAVLMQGGPVQPKIFDLPALAICLYYGNHVQYVHNQLDIHIRMW